jgi:Ca2+-binding RTX toxin-like protein
VPNHLAAGAERTTISGALAGDPSTTITLENFDPGPGGDVVYLGDYLAAKGWSNFSHLGDRLRLLQDGSDAVVVVQRDSTSALEPLVILKQVDVSELTAHNIRLRDDLSGTSGGDTVGGGYGGDLVDGGAGDDLLLGGNGDSGDGPDHIIGGLGDDTLIGYFGSDSLQGGEGNDALYGSHTNWIGFESNDFDTIDGGSGIDRTVLDLNGSIAGLSFDVAADPIIHYKISPLISYKVQLISIESTEIWASNFDDVISGGSGDDTIYGFEGSNTLRGAGGDDWIYGGSRRDELYGGEGNDSLYGSGGNNYVEGGAGNDLILADAGDDSLFGGDGNDSVTDFGGNNHIEGGGGSDTLAGDTGKDTILGGTGNDLIEGGAESDRLSGDEGDDTLLGTMGNDTIIGGDGSDRATFAGARSSYIIEALPDGSFRVTDLNSAWSEGIDIVSGVEFFEFQGAVISAEELAGAAGTPPTSDGKRSYQSGKGADNLSAVASDADGTMLEGLAGDDTLRGGVFDDILTGGSGDDELFGGGGADQFRFFGNQMAGSDTNWIFDLSFAEGDTLVFGSFAAGTFPKLSGVNGYTSGSAANINSWLGVVNAAKSSELVTAFKSSSDHWDDSLTFRVATASGATEDIIISGGWSQYLAAGGSNNL